MQANRVLLCAAVVLSTGALKAAVLTYAATDQEEFGTLDLNNGLFTLTGTTQLGMSSVVVPGLVGQNGILYGADYGATPPRSLTT